MGLPRRGGRWGRRQGGSGCRAVNDRLGEDLHRAYPIEGREALCMPGKGTARGRQGGRGGERGRAGIGRGVAGGGVWAAWPGSAWPWCRHTNRPLLAPSARPPLSLITFSHSHTHKLMLLIDFLLPRPLLQAPLRGSPCVATMLTFLCGHESCSCSTHSSQLSFSSI